MYGSGAATGLPFTAVVRRPILKALTMGRTVWFVAAAVTAMRGNVVLLTAQSAALAFATATLGSACPYKFCFEVNKSTRQQVNEAMRREGEPPLPTRWEGMLNLCYDSWI